MSLGQVNLHIQEVVLRSKAKFKAKFFGLPSTHTLSTYTTHYTIKEMKNKKLACCCCCY